MYLSASSHSIPSHLYLVLMVMFRLLTLTLILTFKLLTHVVDLNYISVIRINASLNM